MTSSNPHSPGSLDQQSERAHSKLLTERVIVAQIVGLVLILFALLLLRDLPPALFNKALRFWWLGWLALFGLLGWCWVDELNRWFRNRWNNLKQYFRGQTPEATKPPDNSTVNTRIKSRLIWATRVLVIGDTGLLICFILMTGGFGHSPLDLLLPTIPIIAIILGQPSRTVKDAILLQILFTLFLVVDWALDYLRVPHLHYLRVVQAWHYEAHADPRYLLSFAFVAIGSVALSLGEYFYTHRPSPLLDKIPEAVQKLGPSGDDVKKQKKRMEKAITSGTEDWIDWLEAQGLERKDFSSVHDTANVSGQAVILSLPYWDGEATLKTRESITRRIAFLTHAAHWVDDNFDPLIRWRADKNRFQCVQEWGPKKFLESDSRLRQLLARMKSLAPTNRGCYIERSIERIIYGGLIQNAATPQRLNELLAAYQRFVGEGLSAVLKSAYDEVVKRKNITAWITTKVVLELLDCLGDNFSLDQAEFYNLLYGPILYYQDAKKEIEREGFGRAFGKGRKAVEAALPAEDDLLFVIKVICSKMREILGADQLPDSRKSQLSSLLKAYQNELPPLTYQLYQSLISSPATGGPPRTATTTP